MREELKIEACPFCGGEGEVSWYARGSDPACAGYFVECLSCAASGQGFDIQGEMPDREQYTKQCAITAWNTRSNPPQEERSDPLDLAAGDDNRKGLVEALREAEATFEDIRVRLISNLDEPERTAFWRAADGRTKVAQALAAFQSRQEESR